MNLFVNCCPSGYNGESELVTVQVPSKLTEDVLQYVRTLSDAYGIEDTRVMKDIVKTSIMEIERRYYDRKDRKTQKR